MTKNELLDEYEFHDCMIHSMKYVVEEWEINFLLDIDYILEGPMNDEAPFSFRLTKGSIIFHNVIDIGIDINSKIEEHHYNISNPIILKIEVSENMIIKNNITYYEWNIYTIDNKKTFSILASNMKFDPCQNSIIVTRQHLYTEERSLLN